MKILIVEDDLDSGEALLCLLEDVGYDVRLVMNPTLASAAARAFRPDVAILDLGLPGMSGYELLQLLRTLPELTSCRYFAATAMAGVELVKRSMEAGFECHLTKPLPVARLLRLLEGAALSATDAPADRKAASGFIAGERRDHGL